MGRITIIIDEAAPIPDEVFEKLEAMERRPGRGFYMPRTRRELVQWFKDCRPSWKVSRWSLAQLKAVYIKERRAHG